MKVKTIHDFFDKQNGMKRTRVGEVLEVNDGRGQELISFGVAEQMLPETPGRVKMEKDKKQAAE